MRKDLRAQFAYFRGVGASVAMEYACRTPGTRIELACTLRQMRQRIRCSSAWPATERSSGYCPTEVPHAHACTGEGDTRTDTRLRAKRTGTRRYGRLGRPQAIQRGQGESKPMWANCLAVNLGAAQTLRKPVARLGISMSPLGVARGTGRPSRRGETPWHNSALHSRAH